MNTTPHILVVDDDNNNRKYYYQLLCRQNYTVDEADSGETAVELIAKNEYDVVITDLQMYRLGGLDVLKSAKDKNCNTQVLIMTGFGSIPTAVRAMQNGAFDYLSKPVNKDAFLMRVNKALRHKSMEIQLQRQQKEINEFNRMIHRDLELAEKIHKSIIPGGFENEHILVGVAYSPMIEIGGDFCSIHKDAKNNVFINIIDVTGHGIAAALVVHRVYSQVSAIMVDHPEPQIILQQMNDFFYKTFGTTGLYLTMISIKIDFAKSELIFAGAAHPCALHFHPTRKSISRLISKNPIVGFDTMSLNKIVQERRPIKKGEKIILYTDGVIEAENKAREPYGMRGVKRSLERHIRKSADEAVSAIVQDIREYTDNDLRDDVLVIVAEAK